MSEYSIIWQYEIRPEARREFERAYGPDGDWARFFRQDPGYIATRLLKDVTHTNRYVTLDHWRSEDAYRRFAARLKAEYTALDRSFEPLTLSETHLGSYVSQGPSQA